MTGTLLSGTIWYRVGYGSVTVREFSLTYGWELIDGDSILWVKKQVALVTQPRGQCGVVTKFS